MRTRGELKSMQSLPLKYKIAMTERRIKEWYESWVKFTIENEKTGKQRFVTMCCTDYFDQPELKADEWICDREPGQVYISFSGGKDLTVLLHIARQLYSDIKAVFIDTGLEYPEIRKFVKTFENVTVLRPKMKFPEVIKKYGYPIISKEVSEKVRKARQNIRDGKYSLRLCQLGVDPKEYGGLEVDERYDYFGAVEGSKFATKKYRPLLEVDFLTSEECCLEMKKRVAEQFEQSTALVPILAMMASESNKRLQGWLNTGCNAFESDRPQSNPLSFWMEQDILEYIHIHRVEICSVYGSVTYADEPDQMRIEETTDLLIGCDKLCTTGCHRTGCIFCAFGAQSGGKGSDRFLMLKHTHPRQYEYCIGGGEYNKDGIWQPNKQGLGLGHVFDTLNSIYGDDFIRYK